LFNAIVQNNWNDEFSGNRTNLKLVGVEHLRYTSASLPAELVEGARNYHARVTVLDALVHCRFKFVMIFPSAYWRTAPNLCCIFPSLKELDMRFFGFGIGMATAISQQIKSLGKTMDVTWHATMWKLFSWLDSFERSLS
jgi:hypothetical protein